MKMNEDFSKFDEGKWKISFYREKFSEVMAAKEQKSRTVRCMQESCSNEADQTSGSSASSVERTLRDEIKQRLRRRLVEVQPISCMT